MKFHSFAFIFISPGFSPKHNTMSTEKGDFRFKVVGIDAGSKHHVIDVALDLVKEGYQMIELCGGFGPEWVHKVTEALGDKVPVGGVFYGPQFRATLADLMK